MLSVTRDASSRQFNYGFDADAFARSHGFENANHFNHTSNLIDAAYQLLILSREIEARKARIAFLEAELEEVRHVRAN